MPKLLIARAALALVWAGALVLAVGHKVPTTDAELPAAAAALLATYPLIDVIASAFSGRRVNAAISATAAIAIAVTGFGSDAGATLIAFGAWAIISGAIQFATALHHRRSASGGQVAMLISGGLSTLAGISFLSAASMDDAHLAMLGGYMAVGAVLYLVAAARGHHAQTA